MLYSSHVLLAAERSPRPWKNGGGLTTEIAVHPPEASLDAFDWRVSTAEVAAEGPFSQFPGIDRTLVILEGAGMTLAVDCSAPVCLTRATAPFAFAADRPAHARLVDGPITDLNVMSKRATWRHTVKRIDLADLYDFESKATPWIVYCQSGTVRVSAAARTHEIMPKDSVVGVAGGTEIRTNNSSVVYIIELYRV